jgi:mono/diheme cytochrome c family protein
MKKRSQIRWILTGCIIIGISFIIVFFFSPVTIHARIAEEGGFSPSHISARVGKPLHLRLVSDDVEHTFAIGQYSMDPVLLKPHQPVALTLIFDKPGNYTFYTTTPSSLYFWRMRGTIEVTGETPLPPADPPLYVRLGLSLDDEHEEEEEILLSGTPSALRGDAFSGQLDPVFLTWEYYTSHSPMETFESLRAVTTGSDEVVWDLVASIWAGNTTSSALINGEHLYQANCAACHGENGAGDGQFADEMKAIEEENQGEMGIEAPTDFSQPEHLLDAKPAILQGLILRGGMGTGMPMWGSIFTDAQTWDLVAYLYSFQFVYPMEVQ